MSHAPAWFYCTSHFQGDESEKLRVETMVPRIPFQGYWNRSWRQKCNGSVQCLVCWQVNHDEPCVFGKSRCFISTFAICFKHHTHTHTHSLSLTHTHTHTHIIQRIIYIYNSIYHYISPFASLPIQHLKSEKITNAAEVLSRALGARSLVEPFWWSLPKGIRVFDDHNLGEGFATTLALVAFWSVQWLFGILDIHGYFPMVFLWFSYDFPSYIHGPFMAPYFVSKRQQLRQLRPKRASHRFAMVLPEGIESDRQLDTLRLAESWRHIAGWTRKTWPEGKVHR